METANTVQTAKRRRALGQDSPRRAEVDRLSNLPKDLILRILYFLPTEEAIKTGALARRWKSMWKEMRHLRFDSKDHPRSFSDNIISALISHQNQFFQSLTINVRNDCETTDIAIWLGIALVKNASKLVLRLHGIGQPVMFPETSFQRTNTLKTLKLMGNISFDLPIDSVTLNCLTEMHLYHVSFQNKVSFQRLLGGCPKLEDLVLEFYLDSGIETIVINVPSLQRITLASSYCIEEKILLQTPCLEYLNTKKLDGVESFKIEDVSNLIEATITYHEENMDENILTKMVGVQHLSLTAPLEYPPDISFDNLTSLEIQTTPAVWCILLSYMLTSSPNLQYLRLVGGQYCRQARNWIEPHNPAPCLGTHFHTLVWTEYTWDGEDDRDVAIYIIKNAKKLRDATFILPEAREDTDTQQRHAIVSQLRNLHRASPSCNLLFKDSSATNRNPSTSEDPDREGFTI